MQVFSGLPSRLQSISEIRLQLSIENIEPILNEVLETLGAREIEMQDREGRWRLLRVYPYRTSENKIEAQPHAGRTARGLVSQLNTGVRQISLRSHPSVLNDLGL